MGIGGHNTSIRVCVYRTLGQMSSRREVSKRAAKREPTRVGVFFFFFWWSNLEHKSKRWFTFVQAKGCEGFHLAAATPRKCRGTLSERESSVGLGATDGKGHPLRPGGRVALIPTKTSVHINQLKGRFCSLSRVFFQVLRTLRGFAAFRP
jgi:hypothetical protein